MTGHSTVSEKNNQKSREKVAKLLEFLGNIRNLAIFVQDHPDPDAIGSAAGLRRIANSVGINCSLVFSGMVGRSENRALINYLGLNLRPIDRVNLDGFDAIAMVDTQPGTGNNPLPRDILPDIVIDHHPIHKITRCVPFTDIRSGYGATSTILCEYLCACDITPDPPLATALLYGIRSDTLDLGRQAKKRDFEANFYLYSLANLKMLAQIEHSELPRRYYQLLYNALANAQSFGNCVYSRVGRVENPDMIGEVADLLVRREDIEWCLCSGLVNKRVLLSLRASGAKRDAGKVIADIVGKKGTAGGHHSLAGGQIPLEKGTLDELSETETWLVPQFRKVLHVQQPRARRLVRPCP